MPAHAPEQQQHKVQQQDQHMCMHCHMRQHQVLVVLTSS
eukprot:CAMPEP_0202385014 /NCGR_PEP_ID=MMETSP1127-20130417/58386_1 /ASSEMBLY_ACC=CAM_ASM_000462 /TAXON_ID=3047 /ORGANISM="Dunaliella tertiolecta, Strain CCMP1320" /LENGTH=38 /DNA_ID= /DNA_START= /DNA_END= /DNA_ORIENTATION=